LAKCQGARASQYIYVVILVTPRFELSAVIDDISAERTLIRGKVGSKYSPHSLPLMEICDNVIPDGNVYQLKCTDGFYR